MLTVTILYRTLIFMYLEPSSNPSLDTDKMASVFYNVIIPMLNPFIYSLRNNDVKNNLKKLSTIETRLFVFITLKNNLN